MDSLGDGRVGVGELLIQALQKGVMLCRFDFHASGFFDHVGEVDAAVGADVEPVVR
jgi:hypothetical protein